MSKFKAGDKVRLSMSIDYWEKCGLSRHAIYELFLSDEGHLVFYTPNSTLPRYSAHHHPNDFELASDADKHIHHDMIIQWAANPKRELQYRPLGSKKWLPIQSTSLVWSLNCEYRFVDEIVPERVFPITSLGANELEGIYITSDSEVHKQALLTVANAAIKQYILDNEGK